MQPEHFTFFWGGPFSQWALVAFTIGSPFVKGMDRYACAEQYMMAEKARLFCDKDAERAIMAARTPKSMKELGRTVRNFNVQRWDNVAEAVVYRGNYAKFDQNAELWTLLLATAGTTLVEASPWDTVWGIGLAADDPKAQDRNQWRGKNKLGQVLTRVRDDLMRARS